VGAPTAPDATITGVTGRDPATGRFVGGSDAGDLNAALYRAAGRPRTPTPPSTTSVPAAGAFTPTPPASRPVEGDWLQRAVAARRGRRAETTLETDTR
jgi:hypothetical protein